MGIKFKLENGNVREWERQKSMTSTSSIKLVTGTCAWTYHPQRPDDSQWLAVTNHLRLHAVGHTLCHGTDVRQPAYREWRPCLQSPVADEDRM